MQTKDITQTIEFDCSAHEIYESFMDAKKHSDFTAGKVEMSREVGGTFSIYDGGIHGSNIELVPDTKIVQLWRFEYSDWPIDYFSTITLDLKEANGKTVLNFTHTGIPEQYADDIADGWNQYYWDAIKEKLIEKK
jgi:activator of HSP90 ATPase